MTSINSDYMSQMVLQSLTKTDADMTKAMQRLSTGKRINNAGDDAAGGRSHQGALRGAAARRGAAWVGERHRLHGRDATGPGAQAPPTLGAGRGVLR